MSKKIQILSLIARTSHKNIVFGYTFVDICHIEVLLVTYALLYVAENAIISTYGRAYVAKSAISCA
jgi:hypothetical protein